MAQDDVIIHTAQVILDLDTDPERYAVFADYYHVDIPDFDTWVGRVRDSVPGLFPVKFEMVSDRDTLIDAIGDADGIICESLAIDETVLDAANWGRVSGLRTIYGATVGCLGLGEIGREFASRANAFGANVLYHQRSRLPEEIEKPIGAIYCSFEDLLSRSDFVSIHLPSNKSTDAMIDRNAFNRMKHGAFLVNISRAAIIDRDALIEALKSDRLGGVALDVHYEESSPADEPLKNPPKALLTPHSAVAGRDNAAADMEEMIGNLAAAV